MCATMVLGTAATAFAYPTDDQIKAAENVFKNSKNVVAEKYNEDKVITINKTLKGVRGTYAFVDNDSNAMPAIKYNSNDKKAYDYIGEVVDLTVGYKAVNNASVTLQTLVDNYLAGTSFAPTTKVKDAGVAKVAYVFTDAKGNNHVEVANLTGTIGTVAVSSEKAYSTNGDIVIADGSDKYKKNGAIVPAGIVTKADFQSKDLYSYDYTNVELFKADSKNVKSDDDEINCVKFTTAEKFVNDSDLVNTLANAIENGSLTENAVAVVLKAYTTNTVTKSEFNPAGVVLASVSTPTAGYTVSGLSDLMSRTKLTGNVNVFKFNYESYKYDNEVEANIYKLGTVASDVSIAGDKFTFDVTFTGDSGIIIFDQAAEASNNDGVSDTTAAASDAAAPTTTAKAPVTGDVAPIAALAVVMMGACGAMVVASKKRA